MSPSRLGQTVQFRTAIDNGPNGKIYDDWPAIVYKVWPADNHPFLGLVVFKEGKPERLGKVEYSEKAKENCWSELGALPEEEEKK